jgi:hypothetical protein
VAAAATAVDALEVVSRDMNEQSGMRSYLGPEVEAVALGVLDEKDNRLEPSLLFKTDFIRVTYLLNPFFSSSATGPPVADELMMFVVVLY